jgi:polyphosphate kinase
MSKTEQLPLTSNAYLDRDLSWLEFNHRVLHEALDERTPLLERVKFLAIFSSNLDEFFMKRLTRLKARVAAGSSGAQKHLLRVREAVLSLLAAQSQGWTDVIKPELARNNIHLLSWAELNEAQGESARAYFLSNVFPVLTPLAVDPSHPFPFISNLSTSLGVMLQSPDSGERLFARVKVPGTFPQWVLLTTDAEKATDSQRYCFVHLVDLIAANLGDLFDGMNVVEVMPFRVTRNADIEIDDDDIPAESLVEVVEEELRQRRFEKVVRLEHGPPNGTGQLQLLMRKLDLNEHDLYEAQSELDFTDLFAIAGLNLPHLKDKPWHPIAPAGMGDEDADLFAIIRAGDVLVHHPYESFDATVAHFIRWASQDPKVLAIKMTVYRVGADTSFLDALIAAAEAGKQVACLVEVTARFDEQQNLHMADALEKAGVHVAYGVVGLKTHSKTTLVVRQDEDGLRSYAHIGTGNYHVKTARLYVDLGLFTCDPVLVNDVVNLFHHLTGRSLKRDYAKLLVAPVNIRERFMMMIAGEIAYHQTGRPARIIAKMNQLEDRGICEALLEASKAGVSIDLIVRGFCILKPGVPGLSENIRVVSVIGRFLEHSRIFYFANGREDPLEGSFFIGSADWMERNLSQRVEAVTPVESATLRARLWEILQIMLQDQREAWDLHADGSYVQRTPPFDQKSGPAELGTHQTLMDLTRQRADNVGHDSIRDRTKTDSM